MRKVFIQNLLLCSLVLFAQSCTKDNPSSTPANTTVTEDKAFLTTTFDNTINCVKGVRDGVSMQSLITFLALSNGTASNDNWIKNLQTALDNSMGKLQLNSNDSKFNLSTYQGSYSYNFSTQTFSKVASSNTISIYFPSEPSKLTNNCVLKLVSYSDGLFQANAKSIYLPTVVKATLEKDNVLISSVDFSGNFSTGSFPSPLNVICNINLNPHNYKVSISRTTTTQFAVNIELGGDCGSVISGKVYFINDDYNNFRLEDDLDKVELTYTKGNFSVKTNWDARTYYQLTNTSTSNVNSTFVSSVYYGTNKIGDLKFVDVAGARKLFIYYKDGTNENTSFYYDPFTSQLKTVLRPYFGNQVDKWF